MVVSPDAFTNMKKLRILIVLGVHISSQAQVHLPNKLRWLEWPNAPNLEFGSGPIELMRLDVPKSHIRQLGGNSQIFRMLKSINFSDCKSLVSIHDLSSASNVEKLILNRCESLVEVHPSVGSLVNLEVLSLEWCFKLSNFPNTLRTKSLQTLSLIGCSKLEKFPNIDGKMKHLKSLYLRGTAIKELPASVQNLVSVELMDLAFCKSFVRLPSNIYKLKNLKSLNLSGCLNLITFPRNMEDSTDPDGRLGFRKLKYLELSGCNLSKVDFLESFSSFPTLQKLHLSNNKFTHLPRCIDKYYCLNGLYVDGCELLQEIPQLPPNINELSAGRCKSLQKLPHLEGHPNHSLYVNLTSCHELFRKGVNMADVANLSLLEELPTKPSVSIILSGREMPEWIIPCEEDFISFTVPQDFYDEFQGLALCFVLSLEEGKVVDNFCGVTVLVNGQQVSSHVRSFFSMESDHVWLSYGPYGLLSGMEKLLRNDRIHIQVCASSSKGSIKKCGFRLICEQEEEDDLMVELTAPSADRNKLKFFWERSEEDNSIDSEEEDSPIETDSEADSEEEDSPIETDSEEDASPIETDAEEISLPLTKKIRRS